MWNLSNAFTPEFEDKELICITCHEKFIWSAGEQKYFKRHGLTHVPRRCKKCRKLKQDDPHFAERKKEYVGRTTVNTNAGISGKDPNSG